MAPFKICEQISHIKFRACSTSFVLCLYSAADSWPHSHHTDRRLGVLGGNAKLVSETAEIEIVVIGEAAKFGGYLGI